MRALDEIGKLVFRAIADERAIAILARAAVEAISETHYPGVHRAAVESLALSEAGAAEGLDVLRDSDQLPAYSETEAFTALGLPLGFPAGDHAAVFTALRGAHEALADKWLTLAELLPGRTGPCSMAASHGELAIRLGIGPDGKPEIEK